jgi:glycosyltransferase involved in cell wall biosynthesis
MKKISIILPCLDEEESLAICLEEILATIRDDSVEDTKNTDGADCADKDKKNRYLYEIVIVDNGSTDKSKDIALDYAKRYDFIKSVDQPEKGYGSAYQKGFESSDGEYIFMADCDGTYNFQEIPRFIELLESGSDIVIGNRFNKKNNLKKVMPWLHRHIGNPILSFITKKMFRLKTSDVHCGARAIKRSALNKLLIHTRGMEFATEMIVQSARNGLKMSEIDIEYRPRFGRSKLNTFGDGWRHLRFMFLYSPLYTLFLPGVIIFIPGLTLFLLTYFVSIELFNIKLFIHPLFYFSVMMIIGIQMIILSGISKVYAICHLGDKDDRMDRLFKYITLERAGIAGLLVIFIAVLILAKILISWVNSDFDNINQIKNAIFAVTTLAIGSQILFSSFIFSIIGIRDKR